MHIIKTIPALIRLLSAYDWCVMVRLSALFLLLLLLLTGGPASAQEEGETGRDNIPLLSEEKTEQLDAVHGEVSEWLVGKAVWFDSFFNDDNYSSEVNKTRAVASLSIGYSRKDQFEIKPRLHLRLSMPELTDKLKLIIAASDDSEFSAEETPLTDTSLHDDSDNSEVTASLLYFLREKAYSNISVHAGLSFSYLYAGLRYRSSRDYGKWQSRFVNNINYYTDDGWEDTASLEMDRPLSENWLFRTRLAADWLEQENGVSHSLTFRTYQMLDRQRALQYEVAGFFDTRPSYSMTDVQLKLTYRERFYRDWLTLEVSPFISFPQDYDRKPNPAIVFKLEADFGYPETLRTNK